jgi:two-component system, OmpR family, response regulator
MKALCTTFASTVVTMDERARVVVVDDDADFRQTLAESLRLDGLDVRTAGSAAEAMTVVGEHRPDCVLIDVLLPDADGRELARGLRRAHGGGMVLIAVTGASDVDSLDSRSECIDLVMRKPVDMSKLRKLLLRGNEQAPAGSGA